MTAMITETRRVDVTGTLAEGATIALWLAENCPKAARHLSGQFENSRPYERFTVVFEDETEFAKFKLFHSDEFNEPARRQSEHDANRVGVSIFPLCQRSADDVAVIDRHPRGGGR